MEERPIRTLGELRAAALAIKRLHSLALDEDVHVWDRFTPGQVRALILAEAGPDRAKRARYLNYLLEYFDWNEAEPRVAAARALLR
jgi:hypothetical protein